MEAASLDRATRAAICELCSTSYNEDFSRLFDLLPLSNHVLARDADGRLVSHAAWVTRLLQPADHGLLTTAYVEAVATAPAFEGRGLASAVLRRLVEVVSDGFDLAALSPSEPSFYERLGWELWAGPLAIRTKDGLVRSPAEEQVMIYRLPGSPRSLDTSASLSAEYREGELW